jgi:hypothetical protein
MNVTIRDHLRRVKEQTVPPLGLELVLKSGQQYFVKWIFKFSDEDESITVRVWDTRAFTDLDYADLLERISEVQDRSEYEKPELLHPKLDQGNLHVAVDSIACLVEWHDRLWPVPTPDEQSRHRRASELNYSPPARGYRGSR